MAEGVPAIPITWSDFRSPPASAAERAYGYDGGSKTNPAVPKFVASEGEDEEAEMIVDAMGDVRSLCTSRTFVHSPGCTGEAGVKLTASLCIACRLRPQR